MLKIIKDNYKVFVGLVVGILISSTIVYAAGTSVLGTSSSVIYNNSRSGLSSSNVSDALGEVKTIQDRECPAGYTCTCDHKNWNRLDALCGYFVLPGAFNVVYNDVYFTSSISVTSTSGWEHIYSGLYLNAGHLYSFSLEYKIPNSYNVPTAYGVSGISYSILSAVPTNSACNDITLVRGYLPNTVTGWSVANFDFIPSTSGTYYFDLNFGYVSDGYTNRNVLDLGTLYYIEHGSNDCSE